MFPCKSCPRWLVFVGLPFWSPTFLAALNGSRDANATRGKCRRQRHSEIHVSKRIAFANGPRVSLGGIGLGNDLGRRFAVLLPNSPEAGLIKCYGAECSVKCSVKLIRGKSSLVMTQAFMPFGEPTPPDRYETRQISG